jgi:thiosulfate/3-mercaptopyruvate sulfurtransferase
MKIPFLMIFTSLYLVASTAFISSGELKNKLHDKTLVLLDVTDDATYAAGHIPNAIQVNAGAFRHQVEAYQLMNDSKQIETVAQSLGINNDSDIVIYGHGKEKELLKSSYIALSLIVNGAKNVSILDGGYGDWEFENKELVSTKTPTITKGNFTAKFNPNVLVDLKYVKDSIGKVPMLESRPPRFYYGEEQSQGVRRLGHIPLAMTSFWKDKFNADETVLSNKELKSIYMGKHNLNPNKEVIIYCTGGLEASMNWFIAYKELGFTNVKLYDASMREWGNRDDTPMEITPDPTHK